MINKFLTSQIESREEGEVDEGIVPEHIIIIAKLENVD